MGSSSSSLSVTLDKGIYRGGEKMTGKILLRVLADGKVHANELRVKFHCREHASVTVSRQQGTGKNARTVTHTYHENRDIMNMEYCLFRFDQHGGPATLGKGDYAFPFSIDLPVGCPASFGFRQGRNHCSLRYTLQSSLATPGMLFGTSEHNSLVMDVRVEGPYYPVPPAPTLLLPRSDPLAMCCCFKRGTLVSGASLSATTLSNGQQLAVVLALENHSTCRVKAVEVTLVEHVSWHAQGHREWCQRERFSRRISAEQLGTMVSPVSEIEAGLDDGEVLRRINAAIQNTLQGGAAPSSTTEVPIHGYTNTYNSHLITVTHTLVIKICTPFGVNNASHTARIIVQSPPPQPYNSTFDEKMSCQFDIPEPSAPPVPIPADWHPREMNTLPMAHPVWCSYGSEATAVPQVVAVPWTGDHKIQPLLQEQGATQHTLTVQGLVQQLDASYPGAHASIVADWFAANGAVSVLSPSDIGLVFQHCPDPSCQVRIAEFLATRLQGISVQHMIAVTQAILGSSEECHAATGTRLQCVKALARVCVDPANYALLQPSLNNCPLPFIQQLFAPA